MQQMNGTTTTTAAGADATGRVPGGEHPLMNDAKRWAGVLRDFTAEDVEKLRGSVPLFARLGPVGFAICPVILR